MKTINKVINYNIIAWRVFGWADGEVLYATWSALTTCGTPYIWRWAGRVPFLLFHLYPSYCLVLFLEYKYFEQFLIWENFESDFH
jgi:hypothetical protein